MTLEKEFYDKCYDIGIPIDSAVELFRIAEKHYKRRHKIKALKQAGMVLGFGHSSKAITCNFLTYDTNPKFKEFVKSITYEEWIGV